MYLLRVAEITPGSSIGPYSSRKLNDGVAVEAENDLEMCVGKG